MNQPDDDILDDLLQALINARRAIRLLATSREQADAILRTEGIDAAIAKAKGEA